MTQIELVKDLTLKIKALEKELEIEKAQLLEQFRAMSPEDIALNEGKLGGDGIVIQYFPESETVSVDSNKLKEDGIYYKYTKTSKKKDYIKVTLAKGE